MPRRTRRTPSALCHRLHDAGDVQHSGRADGAGTRAARAALRHGGEGLRRRSRAGPRSTVHDEVYAAEVAEAVPDIRNSLSRHFAKLVEIHAAPAWLWPALV